MNVLQSLIAYNDETFQSQKYTQTSEEQRCPPMMSEFNSSRLHPLRSSHCDVGFHGPKFLSTKKELVVDLTVH